ncbi:unnamed protein product [Cylindrotheca closterium]|uniref:Uncharacterized protein n=1 Tax=Cylindrotheca closterium TaxID=2856 RepID=A0AAD2JP99_9STRA|nr:unnamed protein product [Cylindrotheca closterium]
MEKFQSSSKVGANGFQEHPSHHHHHHHHQQQVEEEDFDKKQYQRLRQAQRCLLQRKYDEAIAICSDYFQSIQQHDTNSRSAKSQILVQDDTKSSWIVNLNCQIPHWYYYAESNKDVDIHVDCRDEPMTEPTTLDEMIVIALQATEEKDAQLQMKESSTASLWRRSRKHSSQNHSKHLWKLMTESLSNSSIGLEAFCVWMQFWQAQGLWKESLEWNVSVLCRQSSEIYDSDALCQPAATTISPREELWIECLTHQLPRIRNPKLATDFMGHLEKVMRIDQQPKSGGGGPKTPLNWDATLQDINACLLAVTMADHPQHRTIRLIQEMWSRINCDINEDDMKIAEATTSVEANEFLSPIAMKIIDESWKASLEAASVANQVNESDDLNVKEKQETSMVPFQEEAPPTSPISYYPLPHNPKHQTWIDRLVSFAHHKIHETMRQVTLARNTNPYFKSQVILSLTITILSWRQRKNLKAILSHVLLPIRELLDALKAQ